MGSYEAKLGFPEKISVGGAWIFSGTTHCGDMHVTGLGYLRVGDIPYLW